MNWTKLYHLWNASIYPWDKWCVSQHSELRGCPLRGRKLETRATTQPLTGFHSRSQCICKVLSQVLSQCILHNSYSHFSMISEIEKERTEQINKPYHFPEGTVSAATPPIVFNSFIQLGLLGSAHSKTVSGNLQKHGLRSKENGCN